MLLLVTLLLAPANAATLPAAVAVGSACSVEEPAIVLTETTGAVTDARIALSSWALGVDSRLPGLDGQTGISYALDHSAGLVNSRHGIMEYGCQGSMVAQKLLAYSLGFANVSAGCGLDGFRTIRQQLLATPQCPDGKSFAGEDHEFHRGYAGSFEATAEMILTARTFYAHTADRAVFLLNPERLLCVTPSGGDTAILVGAAKQGLKNTVCSESPLAMVARLPHVFSDNTNAPTAVTQTTHLTAHGKALLALNVSIKTAFTSIKLPLIQRGKSMWPFTVTITREDATPFVAQVCQKAFNASFNRKTWLSVSCGKTFAAGRYTIEVRPQLQSKADGMNPKDSYVFSVGWLTNARPKTSGSAAHWSITDTPDGDQLPPVSGAGRVYSLRLRERLRQAMEWQLRRSRRPSGAYGLFVLGSRAVGDPPIFRGSARRGTFAASGWYDQLKIGWKSAYHNLLYLRSLMAFQELEHAGLVESLPATRYPPLPNITTMVKEDIVRQLVSPNGSVISWIACASTGADCDVLNVDEQQPIVDIGLMAAQAMAAAVLGRAHPQVLTRLWHMVDAARLAPGKFRTSVRPLESISPRLFGPSDKWNVVDSGGFADKIANQSGDWQMFRSGDGYGNFGLHQQNGGSLISDTAFLFAVGSNGKLLRDWQGLVGFVSAARDAILKGEAVAKAGGLPIVPATMHAYLRPRTTDDLVQTLCVAARSHDVRHNASATDWWGNTQCQYYNQVQWSLVSASASIHGFLVGLLDLEIPLQPAQLGPPSVSIHGVSVALGAGLVAIPLPRPTAWPASVARVKVSGMAVAGVVGLRLACVKKQSLKCQLARPHS